MEMYIHCRYFAFCCPQKSRQSAYENEEDFSVKYNNNSGKSVA